MRISDWSSDVCSSDLFQYLNDPEKTRDARHPHHPQWSTLGDIGHVDADGYLYLTDRKSFMIISGGVNIYPQEVENLLITHPRVADARSEEHTSELQSLMRISYAVFCLTKKNKNNTRNAT